MEKKREVKEFWTEVEAPIKGLKDWGPQFYGLGTPGPYPPPNSCIPPASKEEPKRHCNIPLWRNKRRNITPQDSTYKYPVPGLKSKMRGKSTRGVGINPPKVNASPGTIKKYMTQEGGKESPGKQLGAKSKQTDGTIKNGQGRLSMGANSSTHVTEEYEEENKEEK